jgi:hypothetical protein
VADAPGVCWPQVGALRERIDELSEELELARAAAAAAAAATAAAAGHAPATGSSGANTAGGVAVTATATADDQQQQQQQWQRPPSPGRELSELEVAPVKQVPLMGEDTPLEALHAQVRCGQQSPSGDITNNTNETRTGLGAQQHHEWEACLWERGLDLFL